MAQIPPLSSFCKMFRFSAGTHTRLFSAIPDISTFFFCERPLPPFLQSGTSYLFSTRISSDDMSCQKGLVTSQQPPCAWSASLPWLVINLCPPAFMSAPFIGLGWELGAAVLGHDHVVAEWLLQTKPHFPWGRLDS